MINPHISHSQDQHSPEKKRKDSKYSSQNQQRNTTSQNWGNSDSSRGKFFKIETPGNLINRPFEKSEQQNDIFAMISMKNTGRVRNSNQTRGSEQITTLNNSRKASKENFDLIDDEMLNDETSARKNKKKQELTLSQKKKKEKLTEQLKSSKM